MSRASDIRNWLQGEQDYAAGIKLYDKYGADDFLKVVFSKSATRHNQERLLEEMQHMASQEKPAPAIVEEAENTTPIYTALKYPLAQYPKQIQQVLQQANNLYKQAKKLHSELRINKRILAGVPETQWPYLLPAERKTNALTILTLFEQNRNCWKEVEFYEQHGQILSPGKAPKYNLPEGENALRVEIYRLRPLVCKWRKRLDEAKNAERKKLCEEKLKVYELNLTEAERRVNGAV